MSLISRLAALEQRHRADAAAAADAQPAAPLFDHDAYRTAWETIAAGASDRAALMEAMVARFAAAVDQWTRR